VATKVQREVPTRELRAALDELEEGIEALRIAYEKYFSGIERVPPAKQRATMEKRMHEMEVRGVTNTVLRFRINGLRARWVTYKHYWTRMENQLERGMSRRDQLRRRRIERMQPPQPEAPAAQAAQADVKAGGPPPPPPGGRVARQGADPSSQGIDPAHLRSVFKQLVQAKRAAGESTDGLTYQALVRKLTAEAPKLKQKHGCEKLQFTVSTRGGKVRLRAEPGS